MKTLIDILNENKSQWKTTMFASDKPLNNDLFFIVPEKFIYGFTNIENIKADGGLSDEEVEPLKKLKVGDTWKNENKASTEIYLKIK